MQPFSQIIGASDKIATGPAAFKISMFKSVNGRTDTRACGSHKKSPRTSSIVQAIFSFWSFEISEDILRNQKLIIGQDSFSNQRLVYLVPFRSY